MACHVSASPDGCFLYIWYLHVYGCFLEWWYPQTIHFNKVFHYKPSILGYPYFWKQPYTPLKTKMTIEKLRIRRCTLPCFFFGIIIPFSIQTNQPTWKEIYHTRILWVAPVQSINSSFSVPLRWFDFFTFGKWGKLASLNVATDVRLPC